jgi:hypothetical protein
VTPRAAAACRPAPARAAPTAHTRTAPTRTAPARRAVTVHDCLSHLTPVGAHTDRDGCLWAEYACAVDGTGFEISLGTVLDHAHG